MKEEDVYYLEGEAINADELTQQQRTKLFDRLVHTFVNTPLAEKHTFIKRLMLDEGAKEIAGTVSKEYATSLEALQGVWADLNLEQRAEFISFLHNPKASLEGETIYYWLITVQASIEYRGKGFGDVRRNKMVSFTGVVKGKSSVVTPRMMRECAFDFASANPDVDKTQPIGVGEMILLYSEIISEHDFLHFLNDR